MREKFVTMSECVSNNTEEIDTLSATEIEEIVRKENEKVITCLEPQRIQFATNCING